MSKKKVLSGLALLVILAAFLACDNLNTSNDLDGSTSLDPGRVAFSYQIVHTQELIQQQHIHTGWSGEIEYPVISIISSISKLEVYYNEYKDSFNFIEFADVIGEFSEEFFGHNFLVIVLLGENSGSIRHKVRMDANGDIEVTRLIPEVLTLDMAQWTVIIELDNSYKQDQFNVVFIKERVS